MYYVVLNLVIQEEITLSKYKIDAESSTPLSDQLATKIRNEILAEKIKPNARLDSVRDLAESNGIDPMTAYSAIKILKGQGLLFTAGAKGTFVSRDALNLARAQNQMMAKRQLIEVFARLVSLGIPLEDLKTMTNAALTDLRKNK